MSKEMRKLINESNIKKIKRHLMDHDCAVITAYRNELVGCVSDIESINFVDGEIKDFVGDISYETNYDSLGMDFADDEISDFVKSNEKKSDELSFYKKDNQKRNKLLLSVLLINGYGVTSVNGTYIENYLKENSVVVKEHSFFVVNLEDDPNFKKNIIKLGKYFCQDSVLFMDKGDVNNYLYGTNLGEFPGLDKSYSLGEFKEGESEFYTTKGTKSFYLETYKSKNISGKYLVSKTARNLVEQLNKLYN